MSAKLLVHVPSGLLAGCERNEYTEFIDNEPTTRQSIQLLNSARGLAIRFALYTASVESELVVEYIMQSVTPIADEFKDYTSCNIPCLLTYYLLRLQALIYAGRPIMQAELRTIEDLDANIREAPVNSGFYVFSEETVAADETFEFNASHVSFCNYWTVQTRIKLLKAHYSCNSIILLYYLTKQVSILYAATERAIKHLQEKHAATIEL